MRIWMPLLTALILSACATEPTPLPDWSLPDHEFIEAAELVPPTSLCAIQSNGNWTAECWKKFEKYEIIAEGNYVIGTENTLALYDAEQAYNVTMEAGEMQQQLSTLYKDLLNNERRAHKFDNWFYQGVIVLILVGVAL